MGRRAQRIPSWPGVIHSNKGRIHLRRPSCDILTFRLRQSGGPYIPVTPSFAQNRVGPYRVESKQFPPSGLRGSLDVENDNVSRVRRSSQIAVLKSTSHQCSTGTEAVGPFSDGLG